MVVAHAQLPSVLDFIISCFLGIVDGRRTYDVSIHIHLLTKSQNLTEPLSGKAVYYKKREGRGSPQ